MLLQVTNQLWHILKIHAQAQENSPQSVFARYVSDCLLMHCVNMAYESRFAILNEILGKRFVTVQYLGASQV
jgi:hypothetical protein